MDRQKVENRIRFNVNDKRRFLAKSDGVCAHCGKKLDIKSATVEHAVPLGKAGRNEERNLVALCEECNSNKADSVILKDVPNYYKYLNMESLLLLLEYIEEYKEEFNWFTWNNWFEDETFVLTPKGMPVSEDWIKHKESLRLSEKVTVKKAWYSDLDKILDFYRRKTRNDVEFIKKELIYHFTCGSVYAIYNSSAEVVGAFCVGIYDSIETYLPCILHIVYSKKYHLAMLETLSILMNNIRRKTPGLYYGYVFAIYKEDSAYNILKKLISGRDLVNTTDQCMEKYGFSRYFGASTKSKSYNCISTNKLVKELHKNAKNYNELLIKRRETIKRLLPKDIYDAIEGL